MFEQQNPIHSEQNTVNCEACSPELCGAFKEQMLASLKKDRRSPGQIFNSLRQEIIKFSGNTLDEAQATEAARRLIGLFETILAATPKNPPIKLDEHRNKG